jgi:hypothetical protein
VVDEGFFLFVGERQGGGSKFFTAISALKSLNVATREFLAIEAIFFDLSAFAMRAVHGLAESFCKPQRPIKAKVSGF